MLLVALAVLALVPLNFGGMPGASFDPALGLGRTIKLVDFAEESNFRVFNQMNDPVMGGKSYGTFYMDEEAGLGIFQGRVNIVPSLSAPGFSVASSVNDYPDIRSCQAIAIWANSSNSYTGYRFGLGNAHVLWGKFFAYGHKADYQPLTNAWGPILIPLNKFTSYWDDATGDAIVSCEEKQIYCMNQRILRNFGKMEIWAEGVEGDYRLEMKKVEAAQC